MTEDDVRNSFSTNKATLDFLLQHMPKTQAGEGRDYSKPHFIKYYLTNLQQDFLKCYLKDKKTSKFNKYKYKKQKSFILYI